jgi:prepilin-type N-terminal cleavage/methylation domain-containing protein
MSMIGKRHSGFTIVELLIVVVVIGILAAITIVAYNGITASANDAHRVADVDAVKKFMEIYYVENGYYPASNNILDANAATALSSGPLQGLSPEALRGPSATASTVSSWGQWGGDVISAGMDYSYKSFKPDGSGGVQNCTTTTDTCSQFQIYYKVEADDSYKVITSANQ